MSSNRLEKLVSGAISLRIQGRPTEAIRMLVAAERICRIRLFFNWWPSTGNEWRNDLVSLWNLDSFTNSVLHGELPADFSDDVVELRRDFREFGSSLDQKRVLYSALAGECTLQIATCLEDLSRVAESLTAYSRSIRLLGPPARDGWAMFRQLYAGAETRLGQLLQKQGKVELAAKHFATTQAFCRELLNANPADYAMLHELAMPRA